MFGKKLTHAAEKASDDLSRASTAMTGAAWLFAIGVALAGLALLIFSLGGS